MIKEILKSLSDTEIMVIAQELANVDIDEDMVYRQLISKANNGEEFDGLYEEMNSDDRRGTLPRLVAVELAERLRENLLKI